MVVNKADLADSESDLRQVVNYVQTNCKELLDVEPLVFPVSARLAYRAKTAGGEDARDEEMWEKSRFQPLETLFTDTLTGAEQVAVKLAAPLETADRLLDRLGKRLAERQEVLDHDQETLDRLQNHLDDAHDELTNDFSPHIDAVEDVFDDVRERGVQFLNDTIRVRRIQLLRDRERFRKQFQEEVVSETTRQIERVVTKAVDGMLTRTMKLQQRLFQTFAERVRENRPDRRFAADKGFAYDRTEVFETIMNEAERQIRSNDLKREVNRIVENVYSRGLFLAIRWVRASMIEVKTPLSIK